MLAILIRDCWFLLICWSLADSHAVYYPGTGFKLHHSKIWTVALLDP